MEMRESILLKSKYMRRLVSHAVDGWSLRCNWIHPPVGPPNILRGGKYMTRVGGGVRSRFELTTTVGKYMTRTGGLKLALALIGSSGEILIDWSRKNRMTGNGIYTN